MQEKYINLKKISKTNFIKPGQISGLNLCFFLKIALWNLVSNFKEKLKTAYFPTSAEYPNFQTSKYTSENPFTQLLGVLVPSHPLSLQGKGHCSTEVTLYVLIQGWILIPNSLPLSRMGLDSHCRWVYLFSALKSSTGDIWPHPTICSASP